jgi:hypothetical protein
LTDGILQGVPVGAGLHFIELKYEPTSLTVGLWSSGFSAALLAGIWVYWARDRRKLRALAEAATRTGSSSPAR